MTIPQIIIIITIIVLIQYGITFNFLKKAIKNIKNSKDEYEMKNLFILYTVIIGMMTTITVLSIIETNKLHKEMKCPELEKVENVYRIK